VYPWPPVSRTTVGCGCWGGLQKHLWQHATIPKMKKKRKTNERRIMRATSTRIEKFLRCFSNTNNHKIKTKRLVKTSLPEKQT
jgi:hypothetical protein